MSLDQKFNPRFGAIILVLLAALLAISPAGLLKSTKLPIDKITTAILSNSDFVTAEDLADWIINKKPNLQIIDLRTPEEYNQYHIPGAMNVSLSKLFKHPYLDQLRNRKVKIIYSNGERYASQAWVMLKQKGIESYVLLGGLNYWAKAILYPHPPGELAADTEILQYHFRKAASGYFNGGSIAATTNKVAKPRKHKKIILQKAEEEDEGC